jgi:pSer/pThr/pTyr-binding forkhead associated (FHA) protein
MIEFVNRQTIRCWHVICIYLTATCSQLMFFCGAAAMRARLTILRDNTATATVDVSQGRFLMGRGTDCDLRSQSPFVSRHHCVLLSEEDGLHIRDVGSKHGTIVNGRTIGRDEPVLASGDVICLGEIDVQVTLEQPPADTQA